MTVGFATCVQLGLSCIEEILRIGGRLDILITLKDEKARTKSGRIYLDEVAGREQIPLLKINNINDPEVIETLQQRQIDWLFIIGWSQIARAELLATPAQGCAGMHPTLLPVGRGRAAIPWAIIKGLDETGVTLFKLDEGVDTGEIIGQGVIPLTSETTATELYEQVDRMHITLINRHWDDIVNNRVQLTVQDESQASEWPGRKPEDGRIRPDMTMVEAERLVRAVTHPYPGAFFVLEDGRTLRIWRARVNPTAGRIRLADGYLEPLEYELEDPPVPNP
jgi:methionyl-tRNA formyltransferase